MTTRLPILFLAAVAVASGVLAASSVSRVVGPKPYPAALSDALPPEAVDPSTGRHLPTAANTLGWISGVNQTTYDTDCFIPSASGGYWAPGYITGAFVSIYGDASANPPLPKAGDVYYAAIYVTGMGACQTAGVQPWLILPSNTALAISATNPVKCWKNGTPVACSNPSLGYSLSGAYGYNLGYWPDLKLGHIEIWVPVSSSSSGSVTLKARVDTADGWSNPWITPEVSYLVGANSSVPNIQYPTPSSSNITNTMATTISDICNQNGNAGNLFIDLGPTTNYEEASAGSAVAATPPPGYPCWEINVGWSGLNPGTLYHWRGRFTYTGGATVLGADKTFTTTGTIAIPPAPTYVTATAATSTLVSVTWYSSVGATSYQIWRKGGGVLSWGNIGTSINPSYTDTSVVANTAYLYHVKAVNSAGASVDSNDDVATTAIFNDDRLIEFQTVIKAAHLSQLRIAVDALRSLAVLNPGVYTDNPIPAGLKVKAVHIVELRTQYDEAIGKITGRNSSWSTTPVKGGKVTFVDFQELRDRLK